MNEAVELLKQQRDQHEKELSNLQAQAEGVKRAIETAKAKIEALTASIKGLQDLAAKQLGTQYETQKPCTIRIS